MAEIAWQVEIDDGHTGTYAIENTRFTSILQKLNGTVVTERAQVKIHCPADDWS